MSLYSTHSAKKLIKLSLSLSLSLSLRAGMKNSDHNKKPTTASEKSLKEWKLPPSSASDVVSGESGCFGFLPNWKRNTVEKSILLSEGYSTFPLFSKRSTRLYQLWHSFVHVEMVQVALKPTKLGSNASATACLRDTRFTSYRSSILGRVESSLSDGPIYFSYFPGHSVTLSDSPDSFSIDVMIEGGERVILMYKFHYKVMHEPIFVSRFGVDKIGETTLYVANIEQSNRVVSRKIRWGGIGAGEEEVREEDEEASNGAVGGTNVDWKETAEAHVLKVDVPGLEIEQVKVEVEDDRVLVISGERGEEEEEDKDKWHCVERSSGKFLRRVRLPENANMDQSTAAMKSGVLTVTVPKKEVVKKSKVKTISISG